VHIYSVEYRSSRRLVQGMHWENTYPSVENVLRKVSARSVQEGFPKIFMFEVFQSLGECKECARVRITLRDKDN
jgi:hypothetical protein